MHARRSLVTDPVIDRCLAEVAAVRDADDLAPEEIALRLAQFAASARGERCPEVEFHPVARALREVARRVAGDARARDAWERAMGAAMGCANDDGALRTAS